MTPSKHIFLTGFMGAGKSTVGRLLATRRDLPFYDLDDAIVTRHGRSIRELFVAEGEPAFRAIESATLHELCLNPTGVIATGGGVIINEANVSIMCAAGTVIHLDVSPETCWARMQRESQYVHRPLLVDRHDYAAFNALFTSRRARYAALPHRIDVEVETPEEAAAKVLRYLAVQSCQ